MRLSSSKNVVEKRTRDIPHDDKYSISDLTAEEFHRLPGEHPDPVCDSSTICRREIELL
jgi:hypothetical protein